MTTQFTYHPLQDQYRVNFWSSLTGGDTSQQIYSVQGLPLEIYQFPSTSSPSPWLTHSGPNQCLMPPHTSILWNMRFSHCGESYCPSSLSCDCRVHLHRLYYAKGGWCPIIGLRPLNAFSSVQFIFH